MNTISHYLKLWLPSSVIRLIRRGLHRNKSQAGDRFHPFDCVPNSLKPKWIVDVGANVGDVAIAALRSYPECKVICFEPVFAQFNTLRENLDEFGDRVILFNKAVSDETGDGEINVTSFHQASSLESMSDSYRELNPTINVDSKEKIEITKLDDISIQFPTHYVDILKIDVEGHELSVLKGGMEFIAKHVDTIIIEVSLQRDESWENQQLVDIFVLMKEMGFRLVNVLDVYNSNEVTQSKGGDLMLAQMDCVFRHISKLKAHV